MEFYGAWQEVADWVTWASKITIKNFQLCSIKMKGSHAPCDVTCNRSIASYCVVQLVATKRPSGRPKKSPSTESTCTASLPSPYENSKVEKGATRCVAISILHPSSEAGDRCLRTSRDDSIFN